MIRISAEECTECTQFNITGTRGTVSLTELTDNMTLPQHRECVVLITAPPGHFIQITPVNFDPYNAGIVLFRIYDTANGQIFSSSIIWYYTTFPVFQSRCNQVYVVLGAGEELPTPNTPWLAFDYEAKPQSVRAQLPVVFTSADAGYVTSPGFDGQTAYPPHIDAFADLNTPPGDVVMISFPYMDLDDPQYNCTVLLQQTKDDYISLYELDNDTATLLFRRCGSTVIVPKVYNNSLRVHFSTGRYEGNVGFKMLFSFHPGSKSPPILDSGLFNCSMPHYASFKQHLHCNLEPECQGGEDERDCPFGSHPACNGSLGYQNMCFKYVSWHEKIPWDQANNECIKNGGRLASLSTKEKLETFQKLFLYGQRRGAVYVGGSTVEDYTVPLLYRDVWQWRDQTMALNINISLYFRSRTATHTSAYRVCLVYHPTLSRMVFFIISCDKPLHSNFLCEYQAQTTLVSDADRQTQGISIQSPSSTLNTDVTTSLCPDRHVTYDFLSCDPASRCGVDVYLTTCSVPGQGIMSKFVCNNSRETLPFTLVCDFSQDCADGSDEDFCRHPACTERTCTNGQCVSAGQWCDNVGHCKDGSDEIDCLTDRLYIVNVFPYERRWMSPPALVDFDGRGSYVVTHLIRQNACPETHFLCPSSYCLPVYVRCNGVYDCPGHEDEAGCQQYTCPGFYRCRASSVCVHPQHVCDGAFQCPQQDDEWMCSRNLTCPEGCVCQGLAFACTKPFLAAAYPDLRYLDASDSGKTQQDLTTNLYLVHLVLSCSNLSVVPNMSLPNLVFLDLSQNALQTLSMDSFLSLKNLRVLSLARNPLVSVLKSHSLGAHNHLLVLDLSHTLLQEVASELFSVFTALETLNVSYSRVHTIGHSGFSFTPNLKILDVSGNHLRSFPERLFLGVSHLTSVRADNYRLCCKIILPDYFDARLCAAPVDAVSSCEDLLRSNVHRVWLWVVSLVAAVGNTACVVIRFCLQDDLVSTGYSLMFTNLNMANLVMAASLALLMTADMTLRRGYLAQENIWRTSVGCRSAGFLSVLSSVVSALIILGLTVERIIVLGWPASGIKKWILSVYVCVVWFLGITCAALHVYLTCLLDVYHQSGLCLPVPVTVRDSGHSVSVLGLVNPVVHVLVCMGQVRLCWSAHGHLLMTDTSQRTRDRILARRVIPVAVSDTMCWLMVGLLALLAVGGTPIPHAVNAAVAIFVVPVHSALNPCFYIGHLWLETRGAAKERRLRHWLQERAHHAKRTDPDPTRAQCDLNQLHEELSSKNYLHDVLSAQNDSVHHKRSYADPLFPSVDDALEVLRLGINNKCVTYNKIELYFLTSSRK